MKYPDVSGYTLERAKQLLHENGVSIKAIHILKPPRDTCNEYDGSYRVVRIKPLGDSSVEILVCKPL